MTPEHAKELIVFANSLGRGYLKPWKAQSIIGTLEEIPAILLDAKRLSAYVESCLLMEGFGETECANICVWLHDTLVE